MLKTFKSKALAELWREDHSRKIDRRFHARILRLLDRLDKAALPQDMNYAGTGFHALKGFKPIRYAVYVNGPWRLTFEFAEGHTYEVDFEQYH